MEINPTPWVIVLRGSCDGVKAAVSAAKQNGFDGKPAPDDGQKQIESAKRLILDQIDSMPTEFNHIEIRADGRVKAGGSEIHIYVNGSTVL